MRIENKNTAPEIGDDPPLATAAFVMREIKMVVRLMLPAEIAEPHLHVVRQGAEDLLSLAICRAGNPIQGRPPTLADLPIGHLLTMSPEQAASLCTKTKPLVCREQSARRVALFQRHAASLGYWPTPAAEVLTWLSHFPSESQGAFERVRPLSPAIEANIEAQFAKWTRYRRGDQRQK